jgi:hypothetical protein
MVVVNEKDPRQRVLRVSGLLFDADRASSAGGCHTHTQSASFSGYVCGALCLFTTRSDPSTGHCPGSRALNWGDLISHFYLLAQGAPFILSAGPHFACARCLRQRDPSVTRMRSRACCSWQLRSRCDSRASARMCAHITRSEVRICHLRCSG